MTITAIIITKMAAITGTIRFKLLKMTRSVSSAVSLGMSWAGSTVPETSDEIFNEYSNGINIKNKTILYNILNNI